MQGSQKESGELDILWIVAGILLLCGLVFFLFRAYILSTILWVKYFELQIISIFVVNDNYQGLANWAHHTDSTQVQYVMLQLLASEVGNSLKYPCIFLAAIFALILYFKHPDTGYRDIESMKTLANKVRKMFPAINIVNGLDLVNTPVDQAPWAMADTPIEFATSIFILDSGASISVEATCKTFGLTDTEKLALSTRVHGPSSEGATFIAQFVTKRGMNTQLLTSTISPVELWAFNTTVEDVLVRDALYKKIGPVSARRLLAERFPKGSAMDEIEMELKSDPTFTAHLVCEKFVNEIVAIHRKQQQKKGLHLSEQGLL